MKWKTEDGAGAPTSRGRWSACWPSPRRSPRPRSSGKSSYLGASTTFFVRAAGMMEQAVCPEHVEANAYFTKEKVKVDWQFMVVTGIFLGALISSLTDKSFKLELSPPAWRDRFGPGRGPAGGRSRGGGALAMFGARLADGCPSGHGLSGLLSSR